jgi:hypothetical protein
MRTISRPGVVLNFELAEIPRVLHLLHRKRKRFVVRANEKLTAFLELEQVIRIGDALRLTRR